jgi:hypothetical protein
VPPLRESADEAGALRPEAVDHADRRVLVEEEREVLNR